MDNSSDIPVLLDEVELAFDALIQGESGTLLGIVKDTPLGSDKGVNVYRQTSLTALINAVCETYTICRHVLGDEYFNQCTVSFCQKYPMVENDLNLYGGAFPAYLKTLVETRAELADLAYLIDLSNLEWAMNLVYFANKKSTFDIAGFANLTDEQRGELTFKLSPDVLLLKSHYNVREIYKFHQDEDNLVNQRTCDLVSDGYYYIIRRGSREALFNIIIDELDEYTYSVLSAIQTQTSFSVLCEEFVLTIEGVLQPPPLGDYISQGFIDDYCLQEIVQ